MPIRPVDSQDAGDRVECGRPPAGQMSTPNTCSSFATQHWAAKRGVVMQPRKDWRFVRDFYNDREYGQGVFKLPMRFRIQVPE